MFVLFKRTDIELLAVAVVALTVGCSVSWSYWGYFFSRPPVPEQIARAAQVESLANVQCTTNDFRTFNCRVLEEKEGARIERIASARLYGDRVVEIRLLLPLADAGLSPDTAPQPNSLDVGQLLALADDYVAADAGYRYGGWFWGYAAVVIDERGNRATVVSVQSGEVSNDHHVFYERVFAPEKSGWSLVDSKRFFFDVAGIEGFEWPFLHVVFLLPSFFLWAIVRCCCYVVSEILTSLREGKAALR